jgi:ParB family chromosome partitioning protein
MAIKTSELNAKLFGKANKRRVSSPEQAQSAAKSKAQVIELAVAGEAPIEFELTTVSAAQIESNTVVFEQNAREQSFLNETALSDILSTLKEHGQQYPAVGRRTADGKIEVLDGSRRRMSCILAKKDFLIYVAESIDVEHAKFLSDVANAHKPLSLYEKGREMQSKLDSGEIADQKGLAELFQCSEALVSGALKAATLPVELLQAYPSVTELGRPTVVKLHKQFFELAPSQQKSVIEKSLSESIVDKQKVELSNLTQITKEVTDTLLEWISEYAPSKLVKTPVKQQLIKGRADYVRKGSNLTLNLKSIDDELSDKILEFVQKTLS